MELQVLSKANSIIVGDMLIKHVDDDLKSLKTQPTRKRVLPLPVKAVATSSVKKSPELFTGNNYKALEKDLKSLSLMPEIAENDLSCKMCSYVASRKENLNTHYKLKHFGGGDLMMKRQICDFFVKTKS